MNAISHLRLLGLAALAAAFSTCAAAPGPQSAPPPARRILFLGDSITYGGTYVEYI